MSAISFARGGDGWAEWSVTRQGDDVHVVVISHAEKVDGQPKVLYDSTFRDDTGRTALDQALGVSSLYADRMAS